MISKVFRKRQLANENNVIIYQVQNNSSEPDRLQIFFRLTRRGLSINRLIPNVLATVFDRIEFTTTTCEFTSYSHSIFLSQFLHCSARHVQPML